MNTFIKSMIVAGILAMVHTAGWAKERESEQTIVTPTSQSTRYLDVGGTVVPVELVRNRRYYRYPYSYGWRPYYYDGPYYYRYYGVPRAGYYDYGYGRGAVRVGPVQVWW